MAEGHAVTGTCTGVRAGMDACLSPCGGLLCSVSCCDEHRARYGYPPRMPEQGATDG